MLYWHVKRSHFCLHPSLRLPWSLPDRPRYHAKPGHAESSSKADREKREMKGERRGRDCFRSPRQEAEPPNKYFGKHGRTSTRKKEKNNKLLVWVVTGATAQRIYLLLRVLCPCLHCSVFFGGSRKCHRDRCRGGIVRKQTQNTQ